MICYNVAITRHLWHELNTYFGLQLHTDIFDPTGAPNGSKMFGPESIIPLVTSTHVAGRTISIAAAAT